MQKQLVPYPHQTQIAEQGSKILKEYGILYLAMEERTGKSLTAILACENCKKAKNVLIVTKKKALKGWQDTLNAYAPKRLNYELINYESLKKAPKIKYDIAIVDESHSKISGFPKPSKTCVALQSYVYESAVIFCSATPSFQSFSQLYHQLGITKYSPFDNFKNFYRWHDVYGIKANKYIYGQVIADYSKCNEQKIESAVGHLFIKYTRKELGFKEEPEDAVHYIAPSQVLKDIYNEFLRKNVLKCGDFLYTGDSASKAFKALHQLEGSTLKLDETTRYIFDFRDKCEYIKANFDLKNKTVAIFYEYIAELSLLQNFFNTEIQRGKVSLYQSSAFAEGVDLSHIDEVVVYSMNFSTSQYVQRRARQCNMMRETPIKVHFLLIKGAVSEQVYNTVAKNRKNFTSHYYKDIAI